MECDAIPRKAPEIVTEHRVTLGTFERDQLKEYLEDLQAKQQLDSIANVLGNAGQAIGYSVAGISIGLGLYYGANFFQSMDAKPLRDRIVGPFTYDPNDNFENSQTKNVQDFGLIYGTFTTFTESIRKAMGLEPLPGMSYD